MIFRTSRRQRADLLGLSALLAALSGGSSLFSALFSGCGPIECSSGTTVTCTGEGACVGSQTCNDGGWDPCTCNTPAATSSSSGTSSVSASSQTSALSSPSNQVSPASSTASTTHATTSATTHATSSATATTANEEDVPTTTPPSDACVAYSASETSGFSLPIIYRDFIGADQGGHSDFETFPQADVLTGAVDVKLGANGPRFVGQSGVGITDAESFASWFQDNVDFNIHINDTLNLTSSEGSFAYKTDRFFPIDAKAQVALDRETTKSNKECGGLANEKHNFSFTSELRLWFDYTGSETLTFEGDDDVWIFVNNRLIVDFGGVHDLVATDPPFAFAQSAKDVSGALLGLQEGGRYELVVFHAERRSCGSNYALTLEQFKIVIPGCQ